jgi:hypothetical protein
LNKGTITMNVFAHRSRLLANRRLLLISGAVALALMALMFASSGRGSLAAVADRCGQPAPDVRFTTSPEELHQFLDGCGEAGRAAYRDLQLIDLVYPAAFGLFLAAALSFLLPRAFPRWSGRVPALAVLPLVGAALDYTENVGAWVLLARYPDPVLPVARLLGIASAAKQLVMWVSVLLVVVSLVGTIVLRLRRRVMRRESRRVEPVPA